LNLKQPPTCAIAKSISILGDKWSLLILRDVILHKKTRFKEFKSSKEKISTNILSNRLKSLMGYGLLEKLNPLGTKKSTRYIATTRGISTLPVIIELYLFSIESIDESILDESQMDIKSQISENRNLFEEKRKAEYLAFIKELSELKTE
jgi:DNA-binding HxlR family transcriptional regulator